MKLRKILAKRGGRSKGKVSVRHQGGEEKRYAREIDFERTKRGIPGRVETIEYDPNRNVAIARILYADGERKYILAPLNVGVNDSVTSGAEASINPGNAMPLSKIPIGTMVHNIEIREGKGGQMVKSAGSYASVFGKEGGWVLVRLPSGEVRKFRAQNYATVGQLANIEAKTERLGKAGRVRHKGIRPRVRGIAMSPRAHPHGGGEGKSTVGMVYPKTPWGKPAVGKTRRVRKYSDKVIVVVRTKKGER